MSRTAALLVAVLALPGCATVVNDAAPTLRVDTLTAAGARLPGAGCTLTNDHGTVRVASGAAARVRRSGDDLDVRCRHAGEPDATGRVVSRVNAGLFGNVLIGGGVGAVVDHATGNAYTYPAWIELVFGEHRVFDRAEAVDGEALRGRASDAVQP